MGADFRERLRHPLLEQGARLAALTAASFVLGLLITTLSVELLGLIAQKGYLLALVTCTVLNFFGCRYWVFRTSRAPFWPEAGRFFASILAFRLLEIWLFHVIFRISGDYRIAYVITQSISMALKFIVAKLFIFRTRVS